MGEIWPIDVDDFEPPTFTYIARPVVEVGDLGDEQWWWANIRASNTEPLLRLNLEASSADFMAERRDALIALLGDPED